MKKYLFVKVVLIAAVLAGLVIPGSPLSSRTSRLGTAATSSEMDRLFRKMGVLSFPHSAESIDFPLEDLNGDAKKLSDFRGKIVFLNFWTTWCPECRREMPSMQRLHAELKDKDFVMVAVNMKEPAAMVKSFFDKYRLTFTGLLDPDGEAGSRMRVRAIPATFILDRSGKILGTVVGGREWDSKDSIALFEHLIGLKDTPS